MPRDELLKGRYSQAGNAYHIIICTDERIPRFVDFWCARIVIQQMRQLHDDGLVDSLAWVLMPDHLHWMFQLGGKRTLSDIVRLLKGRSAVEINRFLGRNGSIWQKGFYDHAIRRDEDLRQVARYIVANPLRAGLVKNINDYPLWDAIWL